MFVEFVELIGVDGEFSLLLENVLFTACIFDFMASMLVDCSGLLAIFVNLSKTSLGISIGLFVVIPMLSIFGN